MWSDLLRKLCDVWEKHGAGLIALHGQSGDIMFQGCTTDNTQKAFDELNPWIEQLLNDRANDDDVAAFNSFEQSGMVALSLPPEDIEKWNEAYWPFVETTVADMEAKGLPARAMVEEIQSLSQ